MPVDLFDAFSVDIQTIPRLVRGGRISGNVVPRQRTLEFPTNRFKEFLDLVELPTGSRRPFVEIGFTGGINDHGSAWDYSFQLRLEDGLDRPEGFINAGAVFVMERTAPAGTVSFDWLIQGNVHHDRPDQWSITKFMRLAVVCPNNGQVFKDEHFTSNARFVNVPTEWSPELQGIRFPITPGHTARFVLEMRHFDPAATGVFRKAIALANGTAAFYGQNERRLEVTNQEMLQTAQYDDDKQ